MFQRITYVGLALSLSACASLTQHQVGLDESGALKACPSAPRCVSSVEADPAKQVAPMVLAASLPNAWERLLELVAAQERTNLVEVNENYARAEIISPWHFYTDDLELLRQADSPRVDVRSTGRLGYYDFNVNRERVEALRQAAQDAGLLHRNK